MAKPDHTPPAGQLWKLLKYMILFSCKLRASMQEFLGEVSSPKLHQEIKLGPFMPYKNPALFSYS